MKQERFLNNEKKLLDYLRENLSDDEYGCIITTDDVLSKQLNVSVQTILRWRKRLIGFGLIKYSCHCVSGKKHGIFELV